MSGPQVKVTISQPGRPDREVEIVTPEARMGRAEDNDLCLPDAGVSRHHARILVQGDRVVFEDTGSGNGSFVQGVRIQRHELADGDEVFIEPFTLKLSIRGLDGEPEATAWIPDESGGEATLLMSGAGAYLEPVAGQGLNPRYDIPATGLTIGRSEQRDVILLDSAASRLHCEVLLGQDGEYWLRDPGSANGTAVNGRVVRDHKLAHGDVIQVGTTQLRFLRGEEGGASTQLMPGGGFTDKTEAFAEVLSSGNLADVPTAPKPSDPRKKTLNLAGGGAAATAGPSAPSSQPTQPPPSAFPPGQGPVAQRPAPRPSLTPSPDLDEPGGSTVAWTAEQLAAAKAASAAETIARPPLNAVGGGFGAPAAGGFGAPTSSGGGFGAPTSSGGGFGIAAPPPDLGALPSDGGFGGDVELDINPDTAKAGRRLRSGGGRSGGGGGFLSKRINQVTVGLFALILLMFGFKVIRDAGVGSGSGGSAGRSDPAVTESSDALDPLDAEEVRRQMDEGVQLFQSGRYYEATSRFLSVLNLDPGHEGAQRMGYVACEFIAVRELQESVNSRAASAADRAKARDDALAMAEDALAGKASISDANEALRAALKLNEGDEALLAAQRKVRGRLAAAAKRAEEKKNEALESELAGLYNEGKAALDRGAWNQAVSSFNKVLQADPERTTGVYYQAEEGISKAKNAMRAQADQPYRDGVAIKGSGDCVSARSKFNEALRLDPYHANAKAELAECQRKLESEASDKFKEARVLESANQIERALSAYQQVIRLVDDKNSPLQQKAQARINEIMQ